jgi:hypothetical protein
MRHAWSRFLEGLLYDLQFALRGLRRDRAFTLAALAMLALAIGLNVTVFTIMDAMLFRGSLGRARRAAAWPGVRCVSTPYCRSL